MMTDSNNNNQEPSATPVIETDGGVESPGEILAKVRQEKKIAVGEAAEALKISAEYVRALETDHYQVLPGIPFVKGYLKSYARLLGLDEKKVLGLYTAMEVNDDDSVKQSPFENFAQRRNWRGQVMFAVLSLMLLSLVGGGVYWRQDYQPGEETASMVQAEFEPSEKPISDEPESLKDLSGTEKAPAKIEAFDNLQANDRADDLQVPDGDAQKVLDAVSNPEVPEEIQSVPLPISTLDSSETMAAVSNNRLLIRFRADCWVQVKDEEGVVLFADLKPVNSELVMTAGGTLNILFGDVSAVEAIYYNGKPVTLDMPVSEGNVGRMKLG